jgi:hypothetical protein
MSKFNRIEELPEVTLLVIKTSQLDSLAIAEHLQKEGHFTDVVRDSVAQLITAYRKSLIPKKITPDDLVLAPFSPLDELLALARLQKARVDKAMEKEKDMPIPLDATNKLIEGYQATLAALQRAQIEFDAAQLKKVPQGGATKATSSLSKRIKEALGASERAMNNSDYD